MASPRPMPPCRRVVEVSPWTNASNRSGVVSALTPTPVSSNSMRTPPPAATAARTSTLPVSVNVIAFDSSLRTMRRTRAASPTTSAGSAGSITAARSRPFSCARPASICTAASTTAARSKGACASASAPPSRAA